MSVGADIPGNNQKLTPCMLSENHATTAHPAELQHLGEKGDHECGNGKEDQSSVAKKYEQARLPWQHGGDGRSGTQVDVRCTTVCSARTGSSPVTQAASR